MKRRAKTMAERPGRYAARERLRNLFAMRDSSGVPVDLPYKADKVLELNGDRERFSRGENGEQIRPCWHWDKGVPSWEMMSTSVPETLQNPQWQPEERESDTAEWTFPETQLNGDPASNVVYEVLCDSSWFRLLVVQPSEETWAPLQCQLRAFKRSDVRGEYEALSYAWKEGDVEDNPWPYFSPTMKEVNKWRPEHITCNGHQLPVKGNLGCALIHIRHTSRLRTIWVDALCINQNDAAEVAAQIQTMPEIYGNAYRTIVWLGMASRYSDTLSPLSLPSPEAAIASVCHLVKHWDPSQPVRYFTMDFETRSAEAKEPHLDCEFARELSHYFRTPRNPWESALNPLKELFEATWFTRKWVIQEVALSRSVDVLFGNCRISWHWIGLAAAVMRMQYDVALREHKLFNAYNAYLMFRLSENHGLDPARMTFVELLRLTAGFMTSKPEDIFFSLLGLETVDHHPGHSPLIKPDQKTSYEDICIFLARNTLEAAQFGPNPLAILMDAGITEGRDRSVPSWAPTWQPGRPGLLSPWSLNDRFEASKGLDVYLDTSSPPYLTVQGIYVSEVECVSPVVMASEDDIASTIDWLSTFYFTDPITPSHLAVYSRTFCAGRNIQGQREYDRTAMVLPFVAFAIYGVLPDTELFQWINTGRMSLPEAQRNPWNAGTGQRITWNAEWREGRVRFAHAAGLVGRGRRLFFTADGHVGLGPGETRPGDSVWILAGAAMPYILRSGCKVVGPSYVDDIMDGEAVTAAQLGKTHTGPLRSERFGLAAERTEGSPVAGEFLVQQVTLQ